MVVVFWSNNPFRVIRIHSSSGAFPGFPLLLNLRIFHSMKLCSNRIFQWLRITRLSVVFAVLFLTQSSYSYGATDDLSQSYAYGVKLYGLTHHISRDWFFHPGIEVDGDYYLSEMFLLRAGAATYQDSGGFWSGFFQFAVFLEAKKFDSFYFRMGIGPSFIWRENWWEKVDGYSGNAFYGKKIQSGPFETNLLWYGGYLELEWIYSKKMRFTYSLVPGYPVIIVNNIGVRFVF